MLLPWNGHERNNSTPALSRENVVGLSRTAGSPVEVKGLQWWEAPGPLRLPQSANGALILEGRTKDTQSVRAISWLQTQGHKPGLSLCHSNHIRVVSAPGSWFTSLFSVSKIWLAKAANACLFPANSSTMLLSLWCKSSQQITVVGSGYRMNVVHSCGMSIPCKVLNYFWYVYTKANIYIVGSDCQKQKC